MTKRVTDPFTADELHAISARALISVGKCANTMWKHSYHQIAVAASHLSYLMKRWDKEMEQQRPGNENSEKGEGHK